MTTGRFAPSRTGPLDMGSLIAAAASGIDARAARGRWLLRIEDIDVPRSVAGAAAEILRTLERLGLWWDGEVVYQSQRSALYRAALERSEEHTSELQSPDHLVCRLLLEKKKKKEQSEQSDMTRTR